MSLTNTAEEALLRLIFHGTTWAAGAVNIAANAGASPATGYYLSFHTADPNITTETGTQATTETTYTNYARVLMPRSSAVGGFSIGVGASQATPNGNIDAPACTAGTHPNLTHFGIGTHATAGVAGYLIVSGALTPAITVQNGVTPRLADTTTISAD